MACGCELYECFSIDYNPCEMWVELPLVANETGNWVLLIEFDGQWTRLLVAVVDGENISIPTVLNEYYTHTIRLLNTSKELFNDTCYKITTQVTSQGQTPSINPNPSKETYELEISAVDGQTVYSDADLIGATILQVTVENDTIPESGYSFSSVTGEMTFNNSFFEGAIIYILYKK